MCELTNYTKDTSSLCKNKQRIKNDFFQPHAGRLLLKRAQKHVGK